MSRGAHKPPCKHTHTARERAQMYSDRGWGGLLGKEETTASAWGMPSTVRKRTPPLLSLPPQPMAGVGRHVPGGPLLSDCPSVPMGHAREDTARPSPQLSLAGVPRLDPSPLAPLLGKAREVQLTEAAEQARWAGRSWVSRRKGPCSRQGLRPPPFPEPGMQHLSWHQSFRL